ncbi:MAG TPA: DUF2059 domain-containing protein [Bryobacteraceae bacterium]|jgi:hypothetical protein|nr:DUF2059 domain-containing protein [Bryobacteraceae bacterium]
MIRARYLLLITLALAAVPSVRADEASKSAKIEKVFQAAKLDQVLNQMYALIENQVKSQMFQQFMGAQLNPEQQKVFDEFEGKVMKVVTTRLSWDQLKPVYLKLYADAFSESDIDGILAFYQSPAGQSLVAKTPQIMAAGSQAAQEKLIGIGPDIQALVQEYIPKMKAAGQPTAH